MPFPLAVSGYTALTQQVRAALESTSGEQLLMPQTTGAATMSLTTQPNAAFSTTTGCHLHFYVEGPAGGSGGTVIITGTKPAGGGGVTSITYHVPAPPQNAQGYFEFTTIEVFATVTASSIATTGLTNSQIWVYGSPAGKYLLPITEDDEEKIPKFSPQDKRGILAKNIRVVQLTKGVSLDKFDCSLYPDSLWMPYALISNTPTITTIPAVATVLLASTNIAATMTLTTQPAAPGEFLIFTITGNTLAGTIVVGGTDQYGSVYSANETITFTSAASQTVYSTRRYSVVNTSSLGVGKFTTTGGTSSSIAVGGVYAWNYLFTNDGLTNLNLFSLCLEIFDGAVNYKLPFTIFSDGTWDWAKEKEVLFTGKGEAQDKLILGDPTGNTSVGVNAFATLTQPTSLPMVSWPGTFTVDTLPGTPGTTQDGSFKTFKIQLMTGQKPFYVADGMQRWSNITRDTEPDYALDATCIVQNYQNYINWFKPNQKIALQATFQGSLLGTLSGTTYWEQWQWTLPGKIDSAKFDMSKSPVELAYKIIAEYSYDLGYYYKLSINTQVPPTYTS